MSSSVKIMSEAEIWRHKNHPKTLMVILHKIQEKGTDRNYQRPFPVSRGFYILWISFSSSSSDMESRGTSGSCLSAAEAAASVA